MLIDEIKARAYINYFNGLKSEFLQEIKKKGISELVALEQINKELYESGIVTKDVDNWYREISDAVKETIDFINGNNPNYFAIEVLKELLYIENESSIKITWLDLSKKLLQAGIHNVNSLSIADFLILAISLNNPYKDASTPGRM